MTVVVDLRLVSPDEALAEPGPQFCSATLAALNTLYRGCLASQLYHVLLDSTDARQEWLLELQDWLTSREARCCGRTATCGVAQGRTSYLALSHDLQHG